MPDWLKARFAAHMNVYANALSALLRLDPDSVHEFWRELGPRSAAHRSPHLIDQIEEVAARMAESSDYVADAFLSACDW